MTENNIVLSKKLSKTLDTYDTILKTVEQMEQKIIDQKKVLDETIVQSKQIKKLVKHMITKQMKKVKDPTKEKKPHGFARPTLISDELSEFIGVEKNSMVSRISVTNYLIDYIKKNNLQNPSNKRIILPDESLTKIFGEESKQKQIDYFTMQKYMNHHFPKNPKKES